MKAEDILKRLKKNLDSLASEKFQKIIKEKKLDKKEYDFSNYKNDDLIILDEEFEHLINEEG